MLFKFNDDIISIDLSKELEESFNPELFNGYDFFFNICSQEIYNYIGSPQNTIVVLYPKNYYRQRRRVLVDKQGKKEVYDFRSFLPYFGNITEKVSYREPNHTISGTIQVAGKVNTDSITDTLQKKLLMRFPKNTLQDYDLLTYITRCNCKTDEFIKEKFAEYKAITHEELPKRFSFFDKSEVMQW